MSVNAAVTELKSQLPPMGPESDVEPDGVSFSPMHVSVILIGR